MSDLPETHKDRGHLAELLFAAEATKRGHKVLLPGGDNCAFDVVVYNKNHRFIRVQIKSCLKKEEGRDRYTFTIKRGGTHNHREYEAVDVDLFGLYCFETSTWHIVPVADVIGETTIKIDSAGKFEHYKENWAYFD